MNEPNDSQESGLGIFRAPLTKEEMREHIVTVLLVLVRQLHFPFCRPDGSHEEAQAKLIGATSTQDMNVPDSSAAVLGLTYDAVRTTSFACDMEMLYDFAFHGMHADDGYSMNSESGPSWISRILYDLANSAFAKAWDDYSECLTAINALLTVCETAEARLILEALSKSEHDTFMGWHGSTSLDGLTFRQLSLLSGISEASLRTMATRNSKRKNPLTTQTEGRSAYIEPSVAREWLISKGRYVPPLNADPQGAVVDLSKEGIRSVDELISRLEQRLHFLLAQDDGPQVRAALEAIDPELIGQRIFDNSPYLRLDEGGRLSDESFLGRLAKALRLPQEMLILKATHLQAIAAVEAVEKRLEAALKPKDA